MDIINVYIMFGNPQHVKDWTAYIEQTCGDCRKYFNFSYVVKKVKTIESFQYINNSFIKRSTSPRPFVIFNEWRNIMIKWDLLVDMLQYIITKQIEYDVISLENNKQTSDMVTVHSDYKMLMHQYDKILEQSNALIINTTSFNGFINAYKNTLTTQELKWFCMTHPAVLVLPSVKNIIGINALCLDMYSTEIKPLHDKSGRITFDKSRGKFIVGANQKTIKLEKPEFSKRYVFLIKTTLEDHTRLINDTTNEVINELTNETTAKICRSSIEKLISKTSLFNNPNFGYYFYYCNSELSEEYKFDSINHTIEIKGTNDFLDQTHLLYTALSILVNKIDIDGIIKHNYCKSTFDLFDDLDNILSTLIKRNLNSKVKMSKLFFNKDAMTDTRTPKNSVLQKYPLYTPPIALIDSKLYFLSLNAINKLLNSKHFVIPYNEVIMAMYVRKHIEKNIVAIFNPFFLEEYFISYVLSNEVNMLI
jgi:protein involved in ribonucleotide reduction